MKTKGGMAWIILPILLVSIGLLAHEGMQTPMGENFEVEDKPVEKEHRLCKSLKDCSDLNKNDWNKKVKWRSLHIKHDDQLEYLRDFYPKKIQRISDLLVESPPDMLDEERQMLEAKILRLKDKHVTTLKEIEFRRKKTFARDPIGTTYYIDYVNGDDAAAGTATGTAWKTIRKYTTTTSRTPGDVAYLRANQVHNETTADIKFDEDGNLSDYIEIRGASSTDDPWSDGSDVKAIVSFGGAAYDFHLSLDDYWKFQNFEVMNSSDSAYEMFHVAYAKGVIINNMVFRDTAGTGTHGLRISIVGYALVSNCEFYSNKDQSLYATSSIVKVVNCTFNGGAGTTDEGISGNCVIYVMNCSFGADTAHDNVDIYMLEDVKYIMSNSDYTSIGWHTYARAATIKIEDYQRVLGNHKYISYPGEVTKNATIVRTGGATSSAEMAPKSGCGLNMPFTLTGNLLSGDFKVWVSNNTQTNITIYMRGYGWTTFPTTATLYTETSYLNTGTLAGRITIKSDEVLVDNMNWVGFDTIFTPSQDGWAYVTVYLGAYQANSGVYVDIKPIVS